MESSGAREKMNGFDPVAWAEKQRQLKKEQLEAFDRLEAALKNMMIVPHEEEE